MINNEKRNILNNVYDYDKRINSCIEKLKKINTKNSKSVIDYNESYLKNNNFSIATQVKWLSRTVPLCEWFKKDFEKCKREDIEKVVEERINKNNGLSPDSKKMNKVALKKLFRWVKKCDDDEYPPEVSWIKTPRNDGRRHINPEDLISDEDIEEMIKIADNPRDKAFIITLAESGCRVGEILTLLVKSLIFDERGAYFLVDGKTGTRRVRVINATPYLHDWLNMHPEKDNPLAPLWISFGTMKGISKRFESGELKQGKEYNNKWSHNFSYPAARKMLVVVARKAGIEKPINPHNFRHSRATALGAAGLNQSIMNEIMGWKQGSTMAGVYIHLSGKHTDDALLPALYGVKLEKEDKKNPQMFPIKCVNCGELNAFNSKRCKKCNHIIGVLSKEDIGQNKVVIEMSKLLGGVIDKKGDLKEQLFDSLKKQIMEELEEKLKKK